MFYFHESAVSRFPSINNRPEFKILVPPGTTARLTMVLHDDDIAPFAFPNPKPTFRRLLAENSVWTPYRISFTDVGLLVVFRDTTLGFAPEGEDSDIYDVRDFAIARPYSSFKPLPDGMLFFIEISNKENKIIEEYSVFICDTDILLSYADSSQHIDKFIKRHS